MNANNQVSSNLKQIRLQFPITALDAFAKAIDELHKMYPNDNKNKKDTTSD